MKLKISIFSARTSLQITADDETNSLLINKKEIKTDVHMFIVRASEIVKKLHNLLEVDVADANSYRIVIEDGKEKTYFAGRYTDPKVYVKLMGLVTEVQNEQ